jgi:hypothetical protein
MMEKRVGILGVIELIKDESLWSGEVPEAKEKGGNS